MSECNDNKSTTLRFLTKLKTNIYNGVEGSAYPFRFF